MKTAIAVILLLAMASVACADNIILKWSSVDVDGYNLYYGTATKTYSTKVDVKKVITYGLTLPAGTYYFAVTGYKSGFEGGLSNEVSATIPAATTLSVEPGSQIIINVK
jgi:hypothetical protein